MSFEVCLPDDFGAFEDSEWGLGLQLVTLPGMQRAAATLGEVTAACSSQVHSTA